jgi:hypothetical protein
MMHLVFDDSNNQGGAGLVGQRAGMQQHTVQLSQLLFAAVFNNTCCHLHTHRSLASAS